MAKSYYEKNFGWIMRELKDRIKNSRVLGIPGLARIEDLEKNFERSEISQLICDGVAWSPRPGFIRLCDEK